MQQLRFILRNGFTLHVSGDNSTHHQDLSPETCRVKPLRRINAIVASCWIYFTIGSGVNNSNLYSEGDHLESRSGHLIP